MVGGYPRPYGGNNVHVQRLQHALQERFAVTVIDVYGKPQAVDDRSILRCGGPPHGVIRALLALRRGRADVAHFHVAAFNKFLWVAYPLLWSLLATTRPIITVHSGSFVKAFQAAPKWRRHLLRSVLQRFFRIITVNEDQRRFVESLGIDPQRIKVVPAFLPPIAMESERVISALDSLKDCERVIVTSGCGLPHYGFHVIIDALSRESMFTTGLIVCAYDSYDERYMAELADRQDVRCTIVRDLNPDEFAWLLNRSEGYVRATDRDGDAVAIREALYFGKVVIASDCVDRPAGTNVFVTGDARSLAVALKDLDTYEIPNTARNIGDAGLRAILEIYSEAIAP